MTQAPPIAPAWRWRTDVAALLALCALTAGGLALEYGRAQADADRHFHFAVSRLGAEGGRVTSLPQVEDLGWGERFVDKEYLFHRLTTLGFWLGGRRGVEVTAWLLALGVTALLYVLSRRFSGPPASALLVAAGVTSAPFIYRLSLLRPHLLGLGAVLLLMVALTASGEGRGKSELRLAAAAGALFALGYHALYLPLAVLGVFAVVGGRWRASLAGAVGLAVGAVANPDFPRTLQVTWMTLTIATRLPSSDTLGVEVLPLSPVELLTRHWSPLAMAFVALAVTVATRRRPALRLRLALVTLALGFWALTLRSARAAEYAAPFSVVALAAVAPLVRRRFLVGGLAALTVVQGPLLVVASRPDALDGYTRHIEDAVAALPAEASGQKVFNCSFTEGAVLLDLRPDVRFIDVLDPTFLALKDPVRHQLRRGLLAGRTPDVAELVHGRFGARYVICGYPPARRLLDADSRFVRLRPPPGQTLPPGSGPYVYALKE